MSTSHPNLSRASAGGSAGARGTTFQVQVVAWWLGQVLRQSRSSNKSFGVSATAIGWSKKPRNVDLAWVDHGYTGKKPAAAAAAHGLELDVVKLAEAKRGFVLLPRRWVVKRFFAWPARFRRLSRDYEWLPTTLAGLHWLAFSSLLPSNLFKTLASTS